MINGNPLLADGIAQSIDDLAKKAKLGGQLVRLQPTGFEQFAFGSRRWRRCFCCSELFALISRFKIPGATLPGVIAGICFVLFFLGHYLAGLAGLGSSGIFRARRYPRSR